MVGGALFGLAIFAALCSLPHYDSINIAMGVSRGVFNGMKGTVSGSIFANYFGFVATPRLYPPQSLGSACLLSESSSHAAPYNIIILLILTSIHCYH